MGNFILYQIFNLMDRTNSIAGIIYMFKTIDFIYKKHENNLFPIGNKFLMLPLNLVQYLGPSVHKTGPIDSILYTMIVSGLLHPFLAILDFFDSYHALATLCKLENLGNLAFLAIFVSKMVEIAHFGGSFFGSKNRSKSSYIGGNFKFLGFLVTLG